MSDPNTVNKPALRPPFGPVRMIIAGVGIVAAAASPLSLIGGLILTSGVNPHPLGLLFIPLIPLSLLGLLIWWLAVRLGR